MSERLTGDYRKYADKKYIYHWDIPEDEDTVVTIDHIELETLENKKKNTQETKLVLYFKEPIKPLALNKKENPSRISKALGSTHIEDWVGQPIALYVAEESRSEDGLAIRVRTYKPKVTEAICTDCGAPITAHGNYSVNKIVIMTENKYGRALCWECAKKAKEEQEEE